MDKYKEFEGHYLIMDNAPIHKNKDIQLYIESRGYRCVYLSPYSPELNPIEQFWSIVKSKLKRVALLEEETLSTRISDACNKVMISDLEGFCRYSASKWDDCLERKNI
jgi:transposase